MNSSRWLLIVAFSVRVAVAYGGSGVITGRVPIEAVRAPIAIEKNWGKISGRVAPPPRPVAAVWLEAPDLRAPSQVKPASVEQRGYQFAEGIVIVPLGARVTFPNMDADYHNVFSLSKAKRFDLGRYKPEERPVPVVIFDKPGVVRLFCEIHEHMRGTVIVVDSPYFTRTGEDGTFRLNGIPPGSYTLRAWADEKRNWQQPVTLSAGQTLEVNLPTK